MKIGTLLFFLLYINCIYCQKLVSISDVVSVTELKDINRGTFKKLIPVTIKGKQDVISIDYSVVPDSVYKERGNTYAIWNLLRFAKGDSIQITSKIMINRFDLTTVKKKIDKNIDYANHDQYLKHEKNFQKNNKKIKTEANKLIGKDDFETLENIFHFVTNHLDYFRFKNENRGAKKALKQGLGDCTEYSELMIALSRANGFPARIIFGKTLERNGRVELHNWPEIFIEKLGWVPFDPTHADGENRITEFSKLENKYVYLSCDRDVSENWWYFFGPNTRKFHFTDKKKWKNLLDPTYFRAVHNYTNQKLESASEILDSLIATTPLNYDYHLYQGMIYARLKDFEKSLSYLQFAMRIAHFKKEKAQVFYTFGNFYALKNEPKSAISHLKEAVRLGYNNVFHLETDIDLITLKNNKEYLNLIESLKN